MPSIALGSPSDYNMARAIRDFLIQLAMRSDNIECLDYPGMGLLPQLRRATRILSVGQMLHYAREKKRGERCVPKSLQALLSLP